MTYIHKKKIKLISLASIIIFFYIYILSVMTANASWVKIQNVEWNQVYAFYYDNAVMDINKSTGVVKTNLIFHFNPTGAHQFIVENGLDIKLHHDLTYVVGAFEFNYKTNKWRILGSTAYDSQKKFTASEPGDPNTKWNDLLNGSIAESWARQICKDYNL